jgi:hypothetical protein
MRSDRTRFAIGIIVCSAWLAMAGTPVLTARQAPGGRGGGQGQGRGGGQGRGAAPQAPQGPQIPRTSAPVDLTGYWVAVITEDWRWRMVTPPKGDTASVPLNPEGVRAANAWDPAKDIAAGEQCRAFGAAGIMRMPVRLHVTWQDDNTLKMEIDNGNQVRLFHFDQGLQAPAAPEWQGVSLAKWETAQEGQGQVPFAGGVAGGQNALNPGLSGSLKTVTTRMRPGYLRRNGVPYGPSATLTEFFDRTTEPNGDSWLVVTSVVEDPQYLTMPFLLTTHFKHEADGAKFQPRPCEVTEPVVGTPR